MLSTGVRAGMDARVSSRGLYSAGSEWLVSASQALTPQAWDSSKTSVERESAGLGGAPQAHGAELDVRSQGILPHQLGQGAAEGAAQQIHLKEAVLGVDPAQGEQRVAVVLRENVRDVVDVAAHVDGIEEPRRLQGAGQVVFGR